ncbi:hypothetical protein Tco_0813662 [Tanacetum coccineum]
MSCTIFSYKKPSPLTILLAPSIFFNLTLHSSMASSQCSSTNLLRKPIISNKPIWKKPIHIDLTKEDDDVKTPSPTSMPHSPTPPNAPLKTPSTRGTPSSSSSMPSRPNSSPFHSS